MMCYKDMTFCSAVCNSKDCFRQFTKEQSEGAKRWWSHDPENVPVAFSDFSDTCEEYDQPVRRLATARNDALDEAYQALISRWEKESEFGIEELANEIWMCASTVLKLKETETKPAIPMSFDWSAVNSKYKYAATDKRGPSYVFEEEPTIGTDCWQSRGGIAKVDKILSSFKRGTVPWDESLIERPQETSE